MTLFFPIESELQTCSISQIRKHTHLAGRQLKVQVLVGDTQRRQHHLKNVLQMAKFAKIGSFLIDTLPPTVCQTHSHAQDGKKQTSGPSCTYNSTTQETNQYHRRVAALVPAEVHGPNQIGSYTHCKELDCLITSLISPETRILRDPRSEYTGYSFSWKDFSSTQMSNASNLTHFSSKLCLSLPSQVSEFLTSGWLRIPRQGGPGIGGIGHGSLLKFA